MADPNVAPLRPGTPPLVERAKEHITTLVIAVVTLALSIGTSLVVVSYQIGRFEGEIQEKIQGDKDARAALSMQLSSLTNHLDALNSRSTDLTVAVTALRVEMENSKALITQERQDRLDDEAHRRQR